MRRSSSPRRSPGASHSRAAAAGPWAIVSRVDGEAELLGQPRDPQQAHRVVGERRGPHEAQAAGAQVGEAPVAVDQGGPAVGRHRQRVDRQVAAGEVLVEGAALQRRQVDREGEVAPLHPPGAEGAREAERGRAGRPRQGPRGGPGVAVHRDVEVGDAAAQQGVADAAPHRPRPLAERRQRRDQGAQGGLGRRGPGHPSSTRGIRLPIAQVIS